MKQILSTQIRSRYERIRDQIEKTASSVGRQPDSVRIVVVTKTHPIGTVIAALEAGIRDLGENYVEEASEKIDGVGTIKELNWHMIGHVQSRKAEIIARKFNYVHSVDSLKLALRLERFAAEYDHQLPILIECNVSGEESKFGYPIFDKNQWAALVTETDKIAQLPHLEICGLMTMPPLGIDIEISRPFFQRLRKMRDYLAERILRGSWKELSMGTSTDFLVAVEEGATIVRIGTAILGTRPALA